MNHHYNDIRSRIAEPPVWFDENAVPRYCPFSPDETANIYAKEVALLLVRCQACEHEFRVCLSWSAMDGVHKIPCLSHNPAGLEYHDPPNINCCAAGPTMNSVPVRVLEFWKKDRFDWERAPALEVESACAWAEDL